MPTSVLEQAQGEIIKSLVREDETGGLSGQPKGDEATPNDPSSQAKPGDSLEGVDPKMISDLKDIRLAYKLSWSVKRRGLVQRVLKAFEYLKNNPYSVFNYGQFEYNPILSVLSGQSPADTLEEYAYSDCIYQMLALSFIAVGQNNNDQTRYMPIDPDNEGDVRFAHKASTIMDDINRRNDMRAKKTLELLYLWTSGSYFSYVRNRVDASLGTTKEPVMGMVDVMALPNRYVCPTCGNVVPEKHTNPFSSPTCDECNQKLTPSDWYPEEAMSIPMQVGEKEVPNSMTVIDIFNLLYVDADPDAQKIENTPILDLVCDMTAAAVRASYPNLYSQITAGNESSDGADDSIDRMARDAVTSPFGRSTGDLIEHRGEFSRCWFQPWAFDHLKDQSRSKALREKFPNGCKLVTWGGTTALEAVEENMLDYWTHCGTLEGLGLFPFGIGDVAMNIQERVNDVANTTHAYMDRLAFPSVLADVDAINIDAMNANPQGGGQVIPVKRVREHTGMRGNLDQYLWQPTYHVDANIWGYGRDLLQLAQLLTGIQPQIFGAGTTRGVDTASGQEQMLNTAMGRLMLFFKQQRSEHARRSRNAIKCTARNIIGRQRIVVPGDSEDEWKNDYILEMDVKGDIEAFPEPDAGYPVSFEEMRSRLQEILESMQENPLARELLNDPDNAAIVARYVLPPGIRVPNAAERAKIKSILQQLAQEDPEVTEGPNGPIVMPSRVPDKDFDDMSMIVTLAKQWGNENYRLQYTEPQKFENVRAYLRLASQYEAEESAQQAIQMQNAAAAKAGQPGAPVPKQEAA